MHQSGFGTKCECRCVALTTARRTLLWGQHMTFSGGGAESRTPSEALCFAWQARALTAQGPAHSCPQLAEADMRALTKDSGFDPTPTSPGALGIRPC
jgi:hypothetical protein